MCRLRRSTGRGFGDRSVRQHTKRTLPARSPPAGVSRRTVRGVPGQDAVRCRHLQSHGSGSLQPQRVQHQAGRHHRRQATSVPWRSNTGL